MKRVLKTGNRGYQALLCAVLAAAVLLCAVFSAGPARATEPDPAAETLFETPGQEPESGTPEGSEDPEATGAEAGEPTEEPTATPEPTQVPDYAEDGTKYLHCGAGGNPTVTLDGVWNAEKKTVEQYASYAGEPAEAGRLFLVPGFDKTGAEALLLEKSFYVDGFDAESQSILISVSRLLYDARIYVNGNLAATLSFSYMSRKIDISTFVRDGENSLRIILRRGDFSAYETGTAPGIAGSVTLECAGEIRFGKVQVIPDTEQGSVVFRTEISAGAGAPDDRLEVNVFEIGVAENGEFATHNGVGTDAVLFRPDGRMSKYVFDLKVRLRGFDATKMWSPANPFLYEAEITLAGITCRLRFGMRTIGVDEDGGNLTLNGSPFFVAGITVDESIALQETLLGTAAGAGIFALFEQLKPLGINTLKGSGTVFPAEWYEAADEAGMFLVSEFPIGMSEEGGATAAAFSTEISSIVSELSNYASAFYWDLCGEAAEVPGIRGAVTGALQADPQSRPVSTGISKPYDENAVIECDVSLLGNSDNVFPKDLTADAPLLHTVKEVSWNIKNTPGARIITSLADFIAVDPDGTPVDAHSAEWWETTLKVLTSDNIPDAYNEILCEMLEYWRTSRKYGGIILPVHVVRKGMSDGFTDGGDFFEKSFAQMLESAFAPAGVNIEIYDITSGRGQTHAIDVAVNNALPEDLGTIEVTLTLTVGSTVLYEETKQYDSLKKFGTAGRDIMRREFSFEMPKSIHDGTQVTLTATIVSGGKTASSTRSAFVSGGATYEAPYSSTAVTFVLIGAGALILGAVVIAMLQARHYSQKGKRTAHK